MARNVKLAYCKCLDYDVRNFIQKGSEYYDEPWMALFSWLEYDSRLDCILSYGCESKEELAGYIRKPIGYSLISVMPFWNH